jgi:hypothetical protein
VPVPADTGGRLWLMPAGPAPHQTYWAALKDLGDRLWLGDPSGRGFMALLDLQARIAAVARPAPKTVVNYAVAGSSPGQGSGSGLGLSGSGGGAGTGTAASSRR